MTPKLGEKSGIDKEIEMKIEIEKWLDVLRCKRSVIEMCEMRIWTWGESSLVVLAMDDLFLQLILY